MDGTVVIVIVFVIVVMQAPPYIYNALLHNGRFSAFFFKEIIYNSL